MNPSKHSSRWPRPLLALGLLLNALTAAAAPAHLTPLLQGKWPPRAHGPAYDVKVVGTRAYVATRYAGLIILDVANPANPVPLGGYDTSGYAEAVAVSGMLAYVADGDAGLQIIDVSNPGSPVRLGGQDTSGQALCVVLTGSRVYVADGSMGLRVSCTLPNVQQMLRVEDGTWGTSFTIEAVTNLNGPIQWLTIFTTNPTALPFEFTDFDVRAGVYPQKFYRVRQP